MRDREANRTLSKRQFLFFCRLGGVAVSLNRIALELRAIRHVHYADMRTKNNELRTAATDACNDAEQSWPKRVRDIDDT